MHRSQNFLEPRPTIRLPYRSLAEDDNYSVILNPIKDNQEMGELKRSSTLIQNAFTRNDQFLSPLGSIANSGLSKKSDLGRSNLIKFAQNDQEPFPMNYSYKPLSKPSLYHFHGKPNEDIDSWFFTLERYFRKLLVNDKDKVDIAVDYLKEGALSTYRSMENKDYLGWQEFKNTLFSIYQSQNLQKILRKKLANLRQMNSLNE